jgi:hypothetical protein
VLFNIIGIVDFELSICYGKLGDKNANEYALKPEKLGRE